MRHETGVEGWAGGREGVCVALLPTAPNYSRQGFRWGVQGFLDSYFGASSAVSAAVVVGKSHQFRSDWMCVILVVT